MGVGEKGGRMSYVTRLCTVAACHKILSFLFLFLFVCLFCLFACLCMSLFLMVFPRFVCGYILLQYEHFVRAK